MALKYTVGELAKLSDVPTSTVRYYERRGLLMPRERSRGNYRLYGEDALERLQFVRGAQAAGFTLADISVILEFREGTTPPCEEIQKLISERLRHVAEQLHHHERIERVLKSWLKVCRHAERTGRCGVIESLATGSAGDGPRSGPRRSKRSKNSTKGP